MIGTQTRFRAIPFPTGSFWARTMLAAAFVLLLLPGQVQAQTTQQAL